MGKVNIGGFLGYGVSNKREFRTFNNATFDRDESTLSLGGNLSTSFDLGNGWHLSPAVKILRSKTVSDAATDSNDFAIRKETELLVRGAFGGELGYRMPVGELVVTPGIRAFLTHDFRLISDYTDRSAVDLGGFIAIAGEEIVAGVEVTTTLDHDDLESVNGRLYAAIKF